MRVERILAGTPVEKYLISAAQIAVLKKNKRVVIWGTARAAEHASCACLDNEIEILCYCDSFSHEKTETFMGEPLISEKVLFEEYSDDTAIIIACDLQYKIDRKLEEKGFKNYTVLDTHLLGQLLFSEPSYVSLLRNNAAVIDELFRLLSDDTSKYVLENILKYRLCLDKSLLQEVYEPNIYFGNDVVSSFSGKTFVDCGAFDGDTLFRFHKKPLFNCDVYYAIEPSCQNYAGLVELIDTHDIAYAKHLNIGVWDRKEELVFSEKGLAGDSISDNGNMRVCVDSIDNIVNIENVGFIKLDVEGSEEKALIGAQKTIGTSQPILAFSVYHKLEDLWSLPLFVKRMFPWYKLYLRHHSLYGDDTVCYAIADK